MTGVRTETYAQFVTRARRKHGDRFSETNLWPQFRSWFETGQRIRVRSASGWERTGTVGVTTGWMPSFLLMHRSNAHGSWDVLGETDRVVAVQRGRTYMPLTDGEDAYGYIGGRR